MGHEVELVADMQDQCGEAPIWDPAGGRLLWVDNERGLVHELCPAIGRASTISRDLMVSALALNRRPGLIFGGAGGLHVWRGNGDFKTLVSDYRGEALNINDMIADRQGRIYAGTLYWGPDGMEKTGRLYLIERDGSLRAVEEGIEISNGLGFSPDDRALFYTDSSMRRIYAYDVHPSSGELSRKRVFVQVPADEGLPDGLTVDAAGFVWSAQWYGGQVVRYDPEGRVALRIRMPMQQVSSVAFGGEDLTDLYVTTAANSWRSRYAPPGYDFDAPNIGGPLYRVRLEIQGRVEHQADFG